MTMSMLDTLDILVIIIALSVAFYMTFKNSNEAIVLVLRIFLGFSILILLPYLLGFA